MTVFIPAWLLGHVPLGEKEDPGDDPRPRRQVLLDRDGEEALRVAARLRRQRAEEAEGAKVRRGLAQAGHGEPERTTAVQHVDGRVVEQPPLLACGLGKLPILLEQVDEDPAADADGDDVQREEIAPRVLPEPVVQLERVADRACLSGGGCTMQIPSPPPSDSKA